MKSIVTKKTFSQLVDTSENPTEEFYFPSTRKHIKKDLSIEITDSFADPSHVKTPRMSLQLSPSLDIQCGDYPVQTPRHGKRPTLFSSRNQQAFSFNFETEPEKALCHNTTTTSSHDYDDFYLKGAFYDVTMRRCNRKTMEDRTTLEPELPGNSLNDKFFGIYDGHTSSNVSDYLQKNMHILLASHGRFIEEPKTALKESIEKIDKQVLENSSISGGSTALCALIRGEKLYVANVGDSKAVLVSNGEVRDLTRQHRASNEDEKMLIESRGGVVIDRKNTSLVQGSLQLSRSIGDRKYKQYITCEPDIVEHEIAKDDQMVIMATDGFWDVMSNQDVKELIQNRENETSGLSKMLVEAAIEKKKYGLDNISLVAIHLQELMKSE